MLAQGRRRDWQSVRENAGSSMAGGLHGHGTPPDRSLPIDRSVAHQPAAAAAAPAHQHVAGRQLVVVQEGLVLLVDLAAHLSIVRLGGRSGGRGAVRGGSWGPACWVLGCA